MIKASVASTNIVQFSANSFESKADLMAVEEPLEIRLGHGKGIDRKQVSVSVTMRTPGNDFELALGFLLSEGIIPSFEVVAHIRYCLNKDSGQEEDNIVRVELKEEYELAWKPDRNFYTTSSCGVCGKASIESVETTAACESFEYSDEKISASVFTELPKALRDKQNIFEHTGGLHAVAIFDSTGKLLMMREDVGRHNAMDKLIGAIAASKTELPNNCITLLSGRASFELIQKGIMAKMPIICAIGAPSSLAVELAQNFNMSLIGFLKQNKFNIYSGKERIADV